jgi:hypothetical protein
MHPNEVESPHLRALVPTCKLLGRLKRQDRGRFTNPAAAQRHLGQPEVQNLGMTTLGHEMACPFDVVMDDLLRVSRTESSGHLDAQRHHGFNLQVVSPNAMLPFSQAITVSAQHKKSYDFTVPSGVPKVTNEVTSGEFWCVSATVNPWDCRAAQQSRQLLNRCTG